MSGGVDLRFDLPAALGDLEKARRYAIECVNGEYDSCAEKLRTVANNVLPEQQPSITTADAIIFTEQEVGHILDNVTIGLARHEYIRLSKPLPPGKYRVLMFITAETK